MKIQVPANWIDAETVEMDPRNQQYGIDRIYAVRDALLGDIDDRFAGVPDGTLWGAALLLVADGYTAESLDEDTETARQEVTEYIDAVAATLTRWNGGRWMEGVTGEPYEGDVGDLSPQDSIDAAEHDGGAGVVIAPDDTRIYWED